MRYVHSCHFCGVWREADTATIVRPRCPGCGCTLASVSREEWDARTEPDPELEPFFVAPMLTQAGSTALRLLGVALAMFLLAWVTAPHGASAAVVAVGLAGLALLPVLVPES